MSVDPPLPASRAALLDAYESLLAEPGIGRGMIARSDAVRIRERHIQDSLRGLAAVSEATRSLCDLGSGGGLPGVVLAIALPAVCVTLAERRRNRISFLEFVVDSLGLDNAEVHAGDVDGLRGTTFDVCTARAFADAVTTWSVAEPLLAPSGRLLYWAGASFAPATVVPGAELAVSAASEVAGSGPVVIMTRQ